MLNTKSAGLFTTPAVTFRASKPNMSASVNTPLKTAEHQAYARCAQSKMYLRSSQAQQTIARKLGPRHTDNIFQSQGLKQSSGNLYNDLRSTKQPVQMMLVANTGEQTLSLISDKTMTFDYLDKIQLKTPNVTLDSKISFDIEKSNDGIPQVKSISTTAPMNDFMDKKFKSRTGQPVMFLGLGKKKTVEPLEDCFIMDQLENQYMIKQKNIISRHVDKQQPCVRALETAYAHSSKGIMHTRMINPEKAAYLYKPVEAKMEQIREACLQACQIEEPEGTGIFFTSDTDASKLVKLMKNFLNTNQEIPQYDNYPEGPMFNRVFVIPKDLMEQLQDVNIEKNSKRNEIQNYFKSKYQIPKELQHWRDIIESSEVNDEALVVKTTVTLVHTASENTLSPELRKYLTKEWKDKVTNFVKWQNDGNFEVVETDEEDTVYIQVFKDLNEKKSLDEDGLQLLCDNMSLYMNNMIFKPNFSNKFLKQKEFLMKKCQISAPTTIKTATSRKMAVLKLQMGLDTLLQMNRNKEQVHEDDKFLVEKLALLNLMSDDLYSQKELAQMAQEKAEFKKKHAM